jgi:hypothetical protein
MKLCYIILAHQNPKLLSRLVNALIGAGHNIALHYDKRAKASDYAKLQKEFGGNPAVRFAKRVRVSWGGWSICQATLNCIEEIEKSGWEPDYVYYASGADFPIRSSEELLAFLSHNRGKEFIEGVPSNKERWVKGGPQEERYQYYFFLNWRSQETLAQFVLQVQKWIGFKRKFVLGLEPFMGAQWWVLTWGTLKKVMELTARPGVLRFFKTTLIPDELFFQTLVCNLVPASRIVARPLTLSQFTDYMVPIIFCADRVSYLARQPYFMARKLSPHRMELYDALEKIWFGPAIAHPIALSRIGIPSAEYETHRLKYRDGAPGLPVYGKSQNDWFGDLGRMNLPFFLVTGISTAELKIAHMVLSCVRKLRCHGQVFHPSFIEFADGATAFAGYKRTDIELRHTSAPNFVAHLVRSEPERFSGIMIRAGQGWHVPELVCNLPNARVLLIRGDPLLAFVEFLMRKHPGLNERIDWNIITATPPAVLAWHWGEFQEKLESDQAWLDKQVNTWLEHKNAESWGGLTEVDLDVSKPSRLHRQGLTRIRADLEGWAGITLSRWRDWMVPAGKTLGVPLMNQVPAHVSRELTTMLSGLEAGRKLTISALAEGGVTLPDAYDPIGLVDLFPDEAFIQEAG